MINTKFLNYFVIPSETRNPLRMQDCTFVQDSSLRCDFVQNDKDF